MDEQEIKLETHLCNSCGRKTTVYSLQSSCGAWFNLCSCCAVNLLQDMITNFKLPMIADLLRKKNA